MLSDEEKEAIEYAKSLVALFDKGIPLKYLEEENDMVKKLLNLITKLQKEIEKKDKRLSRQFKLLNKRDKQIQQALKIAFDYGQADREHHKAWVIDQMVRALTGKEYDKWINDYIYDEETGDSYTWDKGIAP